MGINGRGRTGVEAPHGQKRRADDDLKNDQRLAKRFDLLNLEQNGKLYVPVSAPLPTPPAASYSPSSESMLLDDTANRVYIHNLDAELKNIEDEEEKLVFLPDIEKKLGKIPNNVLRGDVHPSAQGKQMVLYELPHSLSIPEDQDSVRKAILESRKRASEKQAQGMETNDEAQNQPHARGVPLLDKNIQVDDDHDGDNMLDARNDEDAMDIG